MKKLLKLILLQLKVKLGLSVLKSMLKGNSRDRMKVLGSIVLFVVVIASLLSTYLLIFNELLDAVIAVPGNLTQNLFSMLFAFGTLLVLVFGIFYSMGLYFAKDAEFLASLPVKKSVTYLAKFIPALLGEITVFAFIALPGIIIYGIRVGAGPELYIFGLLSVLLLPLLPFAIANIVASLLMSISAVARHRERIATIGSFILFIAFFVLNQLISMNAAHIDKEMIGGFLQGGALTVITRIFSTTVWAADAMLNGSLTSLAILLAVSVVALAVCVAISGRLYLSGALAQKETAKSRKRIDIRSAELKTSSPIAAIFKREWKTVLRSNPYAVNSLISIILGPLMVIMIFVV